MSRRRMGVMLIICLVAGMGCSNKDAVPGGILPKEKMEEVMWDMAQADQYAVLYVAKDSARIDRKAETMRLYEEVFRLNQVTREEFRKSYRYYLDHPVLSQLLFDSVIARGVRARSEMYDRPGQHHPPVGPGKPGVVPPVMPGRQIVPGKPIVPGGPGVSGRPGVSAPGLKVTAGEAARRTQEGMRIRDSVLRAMQMRRDTTRGRP